MLARGWCPCGKQLLWLLWMVSHIQAGSSEGGVPGVASCRCGAQLSRPALRQQPVQAEAMETPQRGGCARAAAGFVLSPARQQPGLGMGSTREEMEQLEQLELFHLRSFPYL